MERREIREEAIYIFFIEWVQIRHMYRVINPMTTAAGVNDSGVIALRLVLHTDSKAVIEGMI